MTEELIALDDGYKPKLIWTEFKKKSGNFFFVSKNFQII